MGQNWKPHWVGARSAPWTETASPSGLQAREGTRKHLLRQPVHLVKGKETWDFPNRIPQLPVWRRQLLGYARAGLSKTPGHFRPRLGSLGNKPGQREGQTRGLSLPYCRPTRRGAFLRTSGPLRVPPPYPTTALLSSRVGVVARGWGKQPPEAGPEHN